MLLQDLVGSSVLTVFVLVGAMSVIAAIEAEWPLRAREPWHTAHLGPNLGLTLLTFATNLFLNAGLVAALLWCEARGIGLLNALPLESVTSAAVAVIVLDLSFYVAHVAMHRLPTLWRFHRVHHSDPAVDVTTTIRQHPGEGVVRYAFMAAFAVAVGAGPGPFAVYRLWSALNGLLEHANVRVPCRLDTLVSLVLVTPNMHKVHHSRLVHETDSNYGNIFSVFDRICATFTPSRRGTAIRYGLDGFDDPDVQTIRGLLAMPFRRGRALSWATGSPRRRSTTPSPPPAPWTS
ncbi:MAG: sterol desaturase family protein [Thermodesulfobacteriota bacterium]